MPAMKLKVRPVTSSHRPQTIRPARIAAGARLAPAEPEARSEQHQRGRHQPGDLAADLTVEEPGDPGAAPHAAGAAHPAADGPGLVTGQPAEPVVAEGELEDRVALRATDVGTAGGRPQRDDRDPPAGGRDHRAEGDEQVSEPLPDPGGGDDHVDQRQRRQDQEGLQHLGQEGQPDQCARERQPPDRGAATRVLDRAQGRVDRARRAGGPASRRGCRSGTSAPRPA